MFGAGIVDLSGRASWVHLALAGLAGLALGIACLVVPPARILGSLILLGIVAAALQRPEIGLVGLVIVTASLLSEDQMPRISIGVGRLVLTDLFLLGLLGLVALRWVVEPDFRLSITPLGLPLLGFWGVAMLSTFVAMGGSDLTLGESLGEARALSSYLAFFAVTNLVREKRQLRVLRNGLLLVATIVALAMIAQYILGPSVRVLPGRIEELYTEGVVYSGVTRVIPPGESVVTVALIVLTAGLALDEDMPSWGLRSLQWMVLAAGVLVTFGRHMWVSIVVVFLVLAWLGGREARRRLAGLGVLAVLLAALILWPSAAKPGSRVASLTEASVARLSSLTETETYADPNSSLRWRSFEYAYALPQIAAHPLLGLGLGARYRPFVLGRDWEGFDGRGYIHNGHLYIMLKAGFLGYLFFAWLSLAFLCRVFRSWRSVTDPALRAGTLGSGLAFLAVLMGSALSPMLISPSWTPIIGITLAMGEAAISWSGR